MTGLDPTCSMWSDSENEDDSDKSIEALSGRGIIKDNGLQRNSDPQTSWSEKIKKAGHSMFGRPWKSSGADLQAVSSSTVVKEKIMTTWNNVKYSEKWLRDKRSHYSTMGQICLLGRIYAPEGFGGIEGGQFDDFALDYYSRLWFTYRTNFEKIPGTKITSDCGWGCMLRVAQMVMGHAILVNRLGRDWRFNRRRRKSLNNRNAVEALTETEDFHSHKDIVLLFEDCSKAPLGLPRLMEISSRQSVGDVNRWYAPTEALVLIKRAILESTCQSIADLTVQLSVDGRVNVLDLEVLTRNWTRKLVLFVTIRLGTTRVNKIYYQHLKELFALDCCLGIAGGKPDHGLWFVGYNDEHVICLDPHVAQEYEPLDAGAWPEENTTEDERGSGTKEDVSKKKKHPLRSFHCSSLSLLPLSEMDPSCAVGFLFQNADQFNTIMRILNIAQVVDIELKENEGNKRTRDPLFTVCYRIPVDTNGEVQEPTEAERLTAEEHGFELL